MSLIFVRTVSDSPPPPNPHLQLVKWPWLWMQGNWSWFWVRINPGLMWFATLERSGGKLVGLVWFIRTCYSRSVNSLCCSFTRFSTASPVYNKLSCAQVFVQLQVTGLMVDVCVLCVCFFRDKDRSRCVALPSFIETSSFWMWETEESSRTQ